METQNFTFKKRLKSMLTVDFRRMLTSPFFYIMMGISLVIPILIFVMTTMMDGSVTTNPQTGATTVMEGFKNVWQIIGTARSENASMQMDIVGMCNINMIFFLIAVFVCVFVADDFRSGYTKNLFTVRSKKTDYVISKSVVGFVAGAGMLVTFFIGAMLGGAMAGLPFTTTNVAGIVMCMLSKIFLVAIFVSIYLLASVFAKQKLWLSILLSLGIGMLFFTMVPMITPLDANFINVLLCCVGGGLFAFGFGALSNLVLNKTDLLR